MTDQLKNIKFIGRYGSGPPYKEPDSMRQATHVYTGPDTAWGLHTWTKVIHAGKGPSGLIKVARLDDNKLFLVAQAHLRPI